MGEFQLAHLTGLEETTKSEIGQLRREIRDKADS
jgi:hypothetical protein